jgi:hypothetical protein
VRQVVNRKEVAIMTNAAPRERTGPALAAKSVAKFDVSGGGLAHLGRDT